MMDTFNGALTLNQPLLHTMRESPYVVRRGLLVVLLVGLLVGGVNGMRTLLSGLNPEREIEQFRQELRENIERAALTASPEQRAVFALVLENIDPAVAIIEEINALPRPLPRPVGVILTSLGILVSQPLSYLSSLLLWVIFTHIAAYWLGGQGSIQQMIGLGALSVAPHALDALAFIPFAGSILSIIASIWGLIVLIAATSAAHQLGTGRAVLAVLLFPLIGLLLALLGCCVLFVLALSALGQA